MFTRIKGFYFKLCASLLMMLGIYMVIGMIVFTNNGLVKSDHDSDKNELHADIKAFNDIVEKLSSKLKNEAKTNTIKLPKTMPLYTTTRKIADFPSLSLFNYFNKVERKTKFKCRAVFDGKIEIRYNKDVWDKKNKVDMYKKWTKKCSYFQEMRGYIMDSLTFEEKNFPIAFSILMFKDVEQTERLLRAIYRPQNFYCIHVDSKTEDSTYEAMKDIAGCFDNVFVLEKRVNITWATMSVLEPELLCLSRLWHVPKKWKYFINLTGQEFPLRTNYELVKILSEFHGASDVDGSFKRSNKKRWEDAGPPPHNLTPTKGSVHVALSRAFADFVLHDARAWDLLKWLGDTTVPDETFFSTLNHNPGLAIPGSYQGLEDLEKQFAKPTVVRYKSWPTGPHKYPCLGKRVRSVCVFGTGDLRTLKNRPEMFANKFYRGYQHALECMEELIFNRTRDEYLGNIEFSSEWYSKLDFVVNRI